MKTSWWRSRQTSWRLLAGLVVSSCLSLGVSAQTAAPAAAAPAAATKAAAPEAAPAATTAPAPPAGSTAQPGWNVPPKWSDVELKPQYASVPGREMNVLLEDKGQWWRTVRNGPVTFYGGILMLVVPALLLAFFAVKGPFKLHSAPSGRLIERFNSAERMVHWTMALSFVALAVSGLILLFGKYLLLPVFGASVFAWTAQVMKAVHNFIGPLFIFSLAAFFFLYVRDNFFKSHDFIWLSKFGGLLSDKEIPSGRFNGGEKVWFWLSIVVLGIVISASGLILLFPNWDSTRELMAEANLVHGVIAILFMAASLAHIYMGTIGTQGAYQGMREGYVDETWAKEHHEMWYNDVRAGKAVQKPVGAAQPAAGDD
ncbi:MAG: formate dehydrogenase subunit gamma [Rhodocyclaceae bacterium]|nr:formate dehydrogenase subunit gamma [Rhodocyclaceae bacterium]MCA3023799.1 formate dehydrogenase subunit gamma [Rhodocyclaceae bacterium]MCA3030632.1 formate dehydrogenase subunit gamma [Rhodocyclaceae bacterium]MCA3034061.1 formate dehydrogenase subunit gamma [Rhodocyclaceae bacterium]MCA3035786.1 formate dehydrogenase subunit gamma [Rhodocyclaceae bacterium]